MSFRSPAPLPDDVVDRLFSALVVRYGAPFTDRWRDLDLAVVKGDWARELTGFAGHLGAIRYALDNLPEKPPTVIEFRKLCNVAPFVPAQPQIEGHVKVRGPTPDEREQLRALAADIKRGSLFARPSRAWAYELIRDDTAGWRNGQVFRSTPTALEMARDAIATDPNRADGPRSVDFDDYQEAA